MVDDNTDFSMDRVPVEVALAALQKQVKELQRIATSVPQSTSPTSSPTTSSDKVEELQQRIQELEKANAKAEYRIEFLLRALDARDNNSK
ncbi:hypothetical protein INT45_004697 [Circinella minor]|uniref:Uncharacterized protein n=1 Tax=Circinella minor TaxID=1195481 RepID=A0A8H7SFL2_9FUNG|nr:hypothetical protein INT45_004697 [Circinella minor]